VISKRAVRHRITFAAALFAASFLALTGRVVKLTTIDSAELRKKAIRQHTQRVAMTSSTGTVIRWR
jgi:hypothetical protein